MVFPDLSLKEECFGLFSLHDRTTADELFKHFEILLESRNVPLEKLVSITSDGAATMTGNQNGFLAKCRNNKKFPFFNVYHCIIHQQVLCVKTLKINDVIDEVVTIINFIRGRALNHRRLKQLIKDMDETSDKSDVIYYTEMRWLSKANMLQRFANLLPINREFLLTKEKEEQVNKLHDFKWLSLSMYAVDLTLIINSINKKLQGKCKVVWDQIQVIRDFELTLVNIIKHCEVNIIDERLQRLKKLSDKSSEERFSGESLIKVTMPVLDEVKKRFKDFRDLEIIAEIAVNPFAIQFERYEDLSKQSNDCFQMLTGLTLVKSVLLLLSLY
ncbi:general transcription factor II-I repeat domain-containing protein 2A-like [Chelonus insularis]|uniref:general transcription factor II-I repeat domain-containing protein 2A-like n=1 Tax=Chelonus insularis TaxID=460826 RepID=UPI00158B8660|nr:general transcription factor II-I repeat domain-containing protein 2A-like [Chelonus insularis]